MTITDKVSHLTRCRHGFLGLALFLLLFKQFSFYLLPHTFVTTPADGRYYIVCTLTGFERVFVPAADNEQGEPSVDQQQLDCPLCSSGALLTALLVSNNFNFFTDAVQAKLISPPDESLLPVPLIHSSRVRAPPVV